MATRMAATPTTVARWMPVPIAVPLAAVGARIVGGSHVAVFLRVCKLVRTFSRERLGACEHCE